jgi:hypothetical protein
MQLKYVGAKPNVSAKGVSFDQTKPDKYTFLNAAIELLEALETAEVEDREVDLTAMEPKIYNSSEMMELVTKHCPDLEAIFGTREEKTKALIDKYTLRVQNNANINEDERRAWLGNIHIMRDYYLQYVTNENAYECALDALADKITSAHINIIRFSLGNNYALVSGHLIPVLRDHTPPYDAELTIEHRNGIAIGKLDMHRPAPSEG